MNNHGPGSIPASNPIMQPRYPHDCPKCRHLGLDRFSNDMYVCPGNYKNPTVMIVYSEKMGDFSYSPINRIDNDEDAMFATAILTAITQGFIQRSSIGGYISTDLLDPPNIFEQMERDYPLPPPEEPFCEHPVMAEVLAETKQTENKLDLEPATTHS